MIEKLDNLTTALFWILLTILCGGLTWSCQKDFEQKLKSEVSLSEKCSKICAPDTGISLATRECLCKAYLKSASELPPTDSVSK